MTNREMAHKDRLFILACDAVGITPTKRQASKWRNKEGVAYIQGKAKALEQLRKEQEQANA